ncbi:MAG: hypothetical protein U5K54_03790 [Cytophagales bacterium]|nr:hypothetical protein [Cytophagales bacterium]
MKRKNPSLHWIADFRDPWSEWDLLDTLSLTSLARKRHQTLERQVLTNADRVITIAPYHVHRLKVLSGKKVDLITNGFDAEDFTGIEKIKTSKFTVRHIGVVDELRDPRPIMEVVKELCTSNPDFVQQVAIEFVGKVNSTFKNYVNSDSNLFQVVKFLDQIPHAQVLAGYGSTDLQLLVLAHTAIAPGNLPGKFFEYLASGKPILGIGPVNGDAAEILNQTKAGVIVERADEAGIKTALLSYYRDWKDGISSKSSGIEMYTREQLTNELIKLLEDF